MAFEQRETSAEHFTVKAGTDLRGFQGYAVKAFPTGFILGTTAAESGLAWLLVNEPNSGEAATVYGAPNVGIAKAGTATVIGVPVTCGNSGTWISTSYTPITSVAQSVPFAGIAMEAVSSGGFFALRLL